MTTFKLLTTAKATAALITLCFGLVSALAQAQNPVKMKKKILFVVTSHDRKGNTGEPTGFYLSEVSHPWEVLAAAGYEIDFVSPEGGKAPVDGFNLGDPVNRKFWNDKAYRHKIENTLKPSQVRPEHYVAIHYAGGHGAMWDFPDNKALAKIAAAVYEQGGIVSAVCHGPAGLVNVRLSDGQYLVDGKRINAFTNEEEAAVKLDKVVPFLLESALIARGAHFEKAGLWQSYVVSDQRVVTGQNPQSAKAIGEAVLVALNSLHAVSRLTCYPVKQSHQAAFRKAMGIYVQQSLTDEDNIMSEAYYEQEDSTALWLIERWADRAGIGRADKSAAAAALVSLAKKALLRPVAITYVADLAPLSRQQWRRASRKEDDQLTIILFVDAQPGSQDDFKSIYRKALPAFRCEPGVVTYQLSQLEADSTRFVTYEKFRSKDAFQYHLDFPPILPVIDYLNTRIKKLPFQQGLHTLIEFAPLIRE
ncbi:antibiotic biosynthesis monooxygenase [Taibaiella helva]|uniref:antibiotic biosynthesis monooxygenase n=1 Tax=Taibaiella helva TaxID=2301235 RepID=UPI00130040F4|nr:antibiotic biosynthesis monooxygenase [Taibaiella helva]